MLFIYTHTQETDRKYWNLSIHISFINFDKFIIAYVLLFNDYILSIRTQYLILSSVELRHDPIILFLAYWLKIILLLNLNGHVLDFNRKDSLKQRKKSPNSVVKLTWSSEK